MVQARTYGIGLDVSPVNSGHALAWLIVALAMFLIPWERPLAQAPDQSSLEPEEEYRQDPDRTRTLPGPATRIQVNGQTYYYQGGYFYRREDNGFLRVEPPLGAELSFLPYGSSRGFEVDGQIYHLSGTGTFYRFNPRRRTYTITTPPYEWRRYYNGDIVGSYEDRLNAYDDPVEIDTLRERAGVPRAYPPTTPGAVDSDGLPLFEANGDTIYRDPRRRAPRPYANVRPEYGASGERIDDRAQWESACRREASASARRGSSLESQKLRLYQRAYRDCIQRYERRR